MIFHVVLPPSAFDVREKNVPQKNVRKNVRKNSFKSGMKQIRHPRLKGSLVWINPFSTQGVQKGVYLGVSTLIPLFYLVSLLSSQRVGPRGRMKQIRHPRLKGQFGFLLFWCEDFSFYFKT